ncbi:trypsin-like peptidase domain-containing protein [Planctomonas sp. JC2975]|uniref:S1C family serine protease n=1 Tax=Planctomonas sp. JC2975 TaxID=2729626 RepID=UPI00197B263E|nr:trypsin-like peptidase domain-containing protein [Planctomonas sp. JC2975]
MSDPQSTPPSGDQQRDGAAPEVPNGRGAASTPAAAPAASDASHAAAATAAAAPAPGGDGRARSGVPAWLVWVIAAVIAVVLGFGAGWFGAWISGARTSSSSGSTGTASGSAGGSCNSVTVADEVLPTIVTINVAAPGGSSVGSGEIIRHDGYIVTNNHVISAAANGGVVAVTFSNGHREQAKIVGRDPQSDLAVLKVSADSQLPTIELGNSEKVVVGQPVVALGAPLGLSSTVTAGIVSALGRNVPVPSDNGSTAILAGAIQTDASINPGNSGGALVDCRGHLIGVNTAISTVPNSEGVGGGGSVGIGFAIPVNLAMRIANQLIETGEVAYPYFGVEVTPIPAAVAERWGIEDGLYIQSVDPKGSAAAAGLQVGDIVTKIDGRPATNSDVITELMLTKKAGDQVQVTYVRDGTEHTVTATLVARP